MSANYSMIFKILEKKKLQRRGHKTNNEF